MVAHADQPLVEEERDAAEEALVQARVVRGLGLAREVDEGKDRTHLDFWTAVVETHPADDLANAQT